MSAAKAPVAPKGLGAGGRKLWRELWNGLVFDVHETALLVELCRTKDRLDALHEAADGKPLTVLNARGDEVAQPLYVEARQQSIVFARLIAALKIPDRSGAIPQHRGTRGVYGPRAVGS